MAVVCLNPNSVSVATLLAQIAEYENCDAFVVVVRVDGCWRTAWTSSIDLGGLSMAALKLTHDITEELHRPTEEPRPGFSGPEKAP